MTGEELEQATREGTVLVWANGEAVVGLVVATPPRPGDTAGDDDRWWVYELHVADRYKPDRRDWWPKRADLRVATAQEMLVMG